MEIKLGYTVVLFGPRFTLARDDSGQGAQASRNLTHAAIAKCRVGPTPSDAREENANKKKHRQKLA